MTGEGVPVAGLWLSRVRSRIVLIYALLLVFNIGAWLWALSISRGSSIFLGTALLAWAFGLRHAVDADHVAAIDNVTRKLMQDGSRPVSVGFFFALGHSGLIFVVVLAIAVATSRLTHDISGWQAIGGIISTSVSALFLFLVSAMNIVILHGVWRNFWLVKSGQHVPGEDIEALLNNRGLFARLFRPLFRMINRPIWMLPLGFLFGLGFDTATEVSLLGMSATQATHGVSLWTILVFPTLFAAGMCLIDTTDGVLMLGAYEWAFVNPLRKLYYNFTITLTSVFVALLIGGIEATAMLSEQFGWQGRFWRLVQAINEQSNLMGMIVIGVFLASWAMSFAFYRYVVAERRA